MTRPRLDLSLYLVTDTAMCGQVGVAETVRRAVRSGVTVVQLRDPSASDEGFIDLGRQVRAVLESTGVPLILNDRVHLVDAIDAQGAHVGQDDLDVVSARAVLGPDRLLGLSVHTMDELDDAHRHLDAVDYLGVGPLRATATKSDHKAVRGLEHLAVLAAASPWPCVAIGGVKAADARALRHNGLAGMAVVSAICGQADIDGATHELAAAWDAAALLPEPGLSSHRAGDGR